MKICKHRLNPLSLTAVRLAREIKHWISAEPAHEKTHPKRPPPLWRFVFALVIRYNEASLLSSEIMKYPHFHHFAQIGQRSFIHTVCTKKPRQLSPRFSACPGPSVRRAQRLCKSCSGESTITFAPEASSSGLSRKPQETQMQSIPAFPAVWISTSVSPI